MLSIAGTELEGVALLTLPKQRDERGTFTKVMHAPTFAEHGLRTDFAEQFFTSSHRHVLRGMHCQLPPHAHAKLVCCVAGRILDVVIDLRKASPSFGRCLALELSADNGLALYLPAGCAHGFLTLSESAITLYAVTSAYVPACDGGVHWKSIGFDWPLDEPIVSARDRELPALSAFANPF